MEARQVKCEKCGSVVSSETRLMTDEDVMLGQHKRIAVIEAQLERVVAERDQLKRALSRQIEIGTPESTPSSAGTALTEREAVLLGVIELVRNHPDFDNGGPMADAMDQALRGETPKLLIDVAHLQRGLKPPSASTFLTDVCDELFGCFIRPTGITFPEREYRCCACDEVIPVTSWVTAPHKDDCIVAKARDHLAQQRPERVPGYSATTTKNPADSETNR